MIILVFRSKIIWTIWAFVKRYVSKNITKKKPFRIIFTDKEGYFGAVDAVNTNNNLAGALVDATAINNNNNVVGDDFGVVDGGSNNNNYKDDEVLTEANWY